MSKSPNYDAEQARLQWQSEVRVALEQGGYVSAMNDTKWRELCLAMYRLQGRKPRFKVKRLVGVEDDCWDSEWFHHPGPYFANEWLDIDPLRREEEVTALLRRHGVPFSREGDYLRVWGYYLPSSPPRFET